jgi:heme exporter protein C
MILTLANPRRFLALVRIVLPWLAAAGVFISAVGFIGAFLFAPADYQQGESVRIMYIHVPSAWLSMACYSLMALSSIGTLVWRHPLADVSAKAIAPIGATFTFLCLITGSLWGRPMWGTWWVWDARLTSVLVLFLIYCGILALWNAYDDPARAGRSAAIMTLVGAVNLPIVKFSVDWWNTLHQPASIFRKGGPTIDVSMLWPLMAIAAGLTLCMLALHLAAMRNEILRRRVRTLGLMAIEKERQTDVDHL